MKLKLEEKHPDSEANSSSWGPGTTVASWWILTIFPGSANREESGQAKASRKGNGQGNEKRWPLWPPEPQ